jgi:hypothetical protein
MKGVIRKKIRSNKVSSVWQFVKERELPFREDSSAGAEESSLLEAVTRERVVMTAGNKSLSGCSGDL